MAAAAEHDGRVAVEHHHLRVLERADLGLDPAQPIEIERALDDAGEPPRRVVHRGGDGDDGHRPGAPATERVGDERARVTPGEHLEVVAVAHISVASRPQHVGRRHRHHAAHAVRGQHRDESRVALVHRGEPRLHAGTGRRPPAHLECRGEGEDRQPVVLQVLVELDPHVVRRLGQDALCPCGLLSTVGDTPDDQETERQESGQRERARELDPQGSAGRGGGGRSHERDGMARDPEAQAMPD
jgi:hypothetical protein